jgi:peptide deformylase
MFLKDVVKVGHPILSRKATVEAAIGPDTDRIIKEMRDVIMYRQDAIAIAAPQIGYSNRIFVTKYAEIPIVIYPNILQLDTDESIALEGCLSLPNIFVHISRPKEIEVTFLNALGRSQRKFLAGDVARVFLHEYDHLEGTLIIDHKDIMEEESAKIQSTDVSKEKTTPK